MGSFPPCGDKMASRNSRSTSSVPCNPISKLFSPKHSNKIVDLVFTGSTAWSRTHHCGQNNCEEKKQNWIKHYILFQNLDYTVEIEHICWLMTESKTHTWKRSWLHQHLDEKRFPKRNIKVSLPKIEAILAK